MNSNSPIDKLTDRLEDLWCWFWKCEHAVVAKSEEWVMKECERCRDRYREYKNE